MSETTASLRFLASVAALALGVVAAVIVIVLGHRTPGPVGSGAAPARTPASSAPATQPGKAAFPAPPQGAVVFSRPDGSDVLALGVVPGRKLGLQASVLSGEGQGVGGLRVSFRVGAKTAAAEPCGAGCYRATASVAGAPKSVDVVVERTAGTTRWHVTMPRPWPPPDASKIVAEATRTFKSLRTFEIQDRLASDARHVVVTRWTIVGPNSLSYQIKDGPAGVIIGSRRWDKVPGADWQVSAQTPIHQPTPFWQSWQDAHVLASTKDDWCVSFFDPKTPAWYELVIAKDTMRPLDMHMNATAHFMHDVYGKFNAPLRVAPPS